MKISKAIYEIVSAYKFAFTDLYILLFSWVYPFVSFFFMI